MPMRTFVHHHGALGDVLLSLPCLAALKREGASIHFAGRPDVGALLRDTGVADDASSSNGARYSSLYAGSIDGATRAFLQQFRTAYLFAAAVGTEPAAALRSVIPDTRVIVTMPPKGAAVPVAEFRRRQFTTDPEPHVGPLLTVPPLLREHAAAMLSPAAREGSGPVVAVNPGSGGRAKRWPLDRFFRLIDELRTTNGPFILILSGPAEDAAFRGRINDFVRHRSGLVHQADADLAAAAALLSQCDLAIGNDSGITHLASSVGCPVIAIFGPTDPMLWRPAGGFAEVISAADLNAISVESVRDAAIGFLMNTPQRSAQACGSAVP